MKFTKKKLIVFGLLLLTTFLVVNFATPIAQAKQRVITVWHALPKKHIPLFESLILEYQSTLHNMARFEIIAFKTPEQLHNKLIKSKERPDIALIDAKWLKAIKGKSDLVCIEDFIKSNIGNSVFISFKNDTFKSMWKNSKHGGKLIAMPFCASNRALLIDTRALEMLKMKKHPRMWGDLIVVGKKYMKDGSEMRSEKVWAFHIPAGEKPEALAAFFQVFLWQIDRDVVEPFLGVDLAGFDSAESKRVLAMLVDMVHKHKIVSVEAVDKEKAMMFVGTPKDYLFLNQTGGNIKVVPWPGKRRSKNDLTVYSFVMFNSNDKNKLEKMWNMIYHVCEFRSALKWSLATPYLPPNKQVTLSPDYFSFLEGNPGMRTFLQQLKNSHLAPMDARRAVVMRILGQHLKMALAKEMAVEDSLNLAADKCNKLFDPDGRYRKKKEELRALGDLVMMVWDMDYGLDDIKSAIDQN
ncbi:MAG: extracellular solute-binding protein [Candidatus Eremiobacteraeota bacterium]|nr:extracellular solute-binding protein [Candidatus Eremiobacteraeota bacterium]